MINSKNPIEKFLQNYRFKMVKEYLKGDVLDFGGNYGELKPYVKGDYTLVNYDHSPMENKQFDIIVMLAVLEHIKNVDVYTIFHKFKKALKKEGHIYLTTPTKIAKPVLELMANIGFIDKANIDEHKHYWNFNDINKLAQSTGFEIFKYNKFQLGFNQYAILKHKK